MVLDGCLVILSICVYAHNIHMVAAAMLMHFVQVRRAPKHTCTLITALGLRIYIINSKKNNLAVKQKCVDRTVLSSDSHQHLTSPTATSDPALQFQTGYSLLISGNKKKDPTAAAKWFEAAAKQVHVKVQSMLGDIYNLETGVAKDHQKGRFLVYQECRARIKCCAVLSWRALVGRQSS